MGLRATFDSYHESSSLPLSLLAPPIIMIENLDSPLWKRVFLATNAEVPVKIINFLNDLIAEASVFPPEFMCQCVLLCTFEFDIDRHGIGRSSNVHSDPDISHLRAKVESLNRELFNAELHVDVLYGVPRWSLRRTFDVLWTNGMRS